MVYDLEERTLIFAKNCIDICKKLPKDSINLNIISQLIRSSGSIGANYREANNSFSKREFFHRIGTCRKEAKESKYWLDLLSHANQGISEKIAPIIDEALQLARIFSSIASKGRQIDPSRSR